MQARIQVVAAGAIIAAERELSAEEASRLLGMHHFRLTPRFGDGVVRIEASPRSGDPVGTTVDVPLHAPVLVNRGFAAVAVHIVLIRAAEVDVGLLPQQRPPLRYPAAPASLASPATT